MSKRKLASVVRIAACDPVPDADRLSVATMVGKGWRVITGRDEYRPGDLAVYFEIDSLLPADDPRYAFLRERCLRKFVSKSGNVLREGLRIKTAKLRGAVSQGLLMPLAGGSFPELRDAEEGDDVTDLLKVEHYDEVQEQLRPSAGDPVCADAMGPFPVEIPKTDEERLQNLGDWFQTMKGRLWQVTMKHDGTSCTIAYAPCVDPENPEIVCSRNLRLKPQTEAGTVPVYWQVARKYGVLEKLKGFREAGGSTLALQGEIVGPGINSDRNKETEYKLYVFRAWDIGKRRFADPAELVEFCSGTGIPHVNVIDPRFPFFDRISTMDEALRYAEGRTPEGNEREGIVCKTVDDGPYASFKVVSNRYLLEQND